MMSFPVELPLDTAACHALIRELLADREQCQARQRLQAATIAAHEEALAKQDQRLAEREQTIVEQQATIDRLVADLALLKRSLFGSRRERYLDDPLQGVLFESTALKTGEQPAAEPMEQAPRRSLAAPATGVVVGCFRIFCRECRCTTS